MGKIEEPLRCIFYFPPGIDKTTSILKSESPNQEISRLKTALSHGKDDKELRSRKLKKQTHTKGKDDKEYLIILLKCFTHYKRVH